MRQFMDEHFMLYNDTAETLFNTYAKDMPIFDYHCHLIPRQIAAVDSRSGTKNGIVQDLSARGPVGCNCIIGSIDIIPLNDTGASEIEDRDR